METGYTKLSTAFSAFFEWEMRDNFLSFSSEIWSGRCFASNPKLEWKWEKRMSRVSYQFFFVRTMSLTHCQPQRLSNSFLPSDVCLWFNLPLCISSWKRYAWSIIWNYPSSLRILFLQKLEIWFLWITGYPIRSSNRSSMEMENTIVEYHCILLSFIGRC